MTEQQRIVKLFQDLLDGSPWIDINIINTISGLSAKEAAKKIHPEYNTIWEIINHMISWRVDVLERVKGNITDSPADNYFRPVKDFSETAWNKTINQLVETNSLWISHINKMKGEEFDLRYPPNKMTFYEHIHGLLQHDAYHLGQVTLLVKSIRKESGK